VIFFVGFFFLMIDFLYRSNVDVVVKKECEDSQVTSFFRARCNLISLFFFGNCVKYGVVGLFI